MRTELQPPAFVPFFWMGSTLVFAFLVSHCFLLCEKSCTGGSLRIDISPYFHGIKHMPFLTLVSKAITETRQKYLTVVDPVSGFSTLAMNNIKEARSNHNNPRTPAKDSMEVDTTQAK
jgi:hypothetical protein